MLQSLKKRFERIDEERLKVEDIPYIAALIFAAILVIGGEVACVLWAIVTLVMGLLDPVKFLMLIPCAILISIFTAIILYVYMKVEDVF